MKKLSLLRSLLAFTSMSLTIIALLCPKTSLAAETDSFTYSCIKIEDSADKINFKLNELLRETIAKANHDIAKHKQYSDLFAEFHFSYYYHKEMFIDDYGLDAFSAFETCIDTNSCEDWPYFERIYVYPKESIYNDAKYNGLTTKFLASNVQLCGVRLGTDKLTHFLKEGFKLFNAKKYYGSTDADLKKYSVILENTFFGKTSTGVFSNADIVANLKGSQFFEDIFAKHIVRGKNGLLKFSNVNICDYIDERFSERVSKNIYYEPQEKVVELKKAIREHLNQCTDKNRSEILARKLHPTSVSDFDKMKVGMSNIIPFLSSPDFRRAKAIMELEPIYQDRHETHIPK